MKQSLNSVVREICTLRCVGVGTILRWIPSTRRPALRKAGLLSNAMQGFHYLMRLGHAINAISEFTKALKKYIKEMGCSATLRLIKETLFSPWLTPIWYEEQTVKTIQLRLQLE